MRRFATVLTAAAALGCSSTEEPAPLPGYGFAKTEAELSAAAPPEVIVTEPAPTLRPKFGEPIPYRIELKIPPGGLLPTACVIRMMRGRSVCVEGVVRLSRGDDGRIVGSGEVASPGQPGTYLFRAICQDQLAAAPGERPKTRETAVKEFKLEVRRP